MKEYTRHCRDCKQDLPYSEFPLKPDNTRDRLCLGCKPPAPSDQQKTEAVRQRDWLRQYIREVKATTPCADCGRTFHYCVMDFDHRDGETKLFNVSSAWLRAGRQRVEDEIAKCDVVCANCHRLRTHTRAGFEIDPKSITPKTRRGLTREDVDRIFVLYAANDVTHKQIAARYGVNRSTITQLLAGKTHTKNRRKKGSRKGSGRAKNIFPDQPLFASIEQKPCE